MRQQKPAWNVRPNRSFSNCTSEEIVSFDILKSYRIVKSSRRPCLLSSVGFFPTPLSQGENIFEARSTKV